MRAICPTDRILALYLLSGLMFNKVIMATYPIAIGMVAIVFGTCPMIATSESKSPATCMRIPKIVRGKPNAKHLLSSR